MNAPTDEHDGCGKRARRKDRSRGIRCAACGGDLNVLVEVPARGQPHEQDYPSTRYFRCGRCAQIQIVDK